MLTVSQRQTVKTPSYSHGLPTISPKQSPDPVTRAVSPTTQNHFLRPFAMKMATDSQLIFTLTISYSDGLTIQWSKAITTISVLRLLLLPHTIVAPTTSHNEDTNQRTVKQ